MMAALDADKVRLLIARGAAPKAEGLSGRTALSVAHRGTQGSVRALLQAGAPGANRALGLASMTGDLEEVNLLLEGGADPTPALTLAVTFGYADIVQGLISGGASAGITEKSGINLLHWAAIANRPEIVAALTMAGVPINAQDKSGFTPIMYAVTIDFGDTQMIKTLLRAGADPNIRNSDGRSAREQARYFRHTQIEDSLR
jgi:ankyrin repeat protein